MTKTTIWVKETALLVLRYCKSCFAIFKYETLHSFKSNLPKTDAVGGNGELAH